MRCGEGARASPCPQSTGFWRAAAGGSTEDCMAGNRIPVRQTNMRDARARADTRYPAVSGKQAHEDARLRPCEPHDNERPSQKGNGMGLFGATRMQGPRSIDHVDFIRGLAIIAEVSGCHARVSFLSPRQSMRARA